MTEPMVYIGYREHKENGEVSVEIILSLNSGDFTGEYHPIIAESGEGSYASLLAKLENNLEKSIKEVKG